MVVEGGQQLYLWVVDAVLVSNLVVSGEKELEKGQGICSRCLSYGWLPEMGKHVHRK